MSNSSMTEFERVNQKNLETGRRALARLESFCEAPYEENEKLLMSILEHNKDTEYGKKYGFADIHSVSEFQKKVPISEYDNYAAYIEDMTENGATGLICADRINHYNKSSGTMGVPKRIPISDDSLQKFYEFSEKLHYGIAEGEFGADITKGKVINILESSAEEDLLPCGSSYTAISNKVTRMNRKSATYTYTSPEEAVYPVGGVDTKYLHVRFALVNKSATIFRATFFGFLLEFMRYIEGNWITLCNDIEEGTIPSDIKLPSEVRPSVMEKIVPMPERAAELRSIFEEGIGPSIMKKIWPDMKLIVGMATGSFKPYYDAMRSRYFGDSISTLTLGYGCSEGYFGLPYELNSQDCVFFTDSAFYEFLPLDAEGDFSKIVTLDGVEEGKEYEVIITNPSGFYRYRMMDVVRIKGRYKNAPTFEMLYRLNLTVSLMGEKTTEQMFTISAQRTAEELGFDLVDYSVYEDTDYSPVRYQIFIEIANAPAGLNPREVRDVLEKNLSAGNPSYGDKINKGILAKLRLNFLAPETYALYKETMIYRGTAPSQVKPVHKITNEVQRKLFFTMTEYSSEVMV